MANFFGGYSPQQSFVPYQQSPANNTVSVVTVQGEAGARVYPVAAGNTVLLIDFDTKKFWLKSTDQNGMPSRFVTFTFTEEIKPPSDNGQFISRNEFDDLKKSIDAQFKQLLDFVKGGSNSAKSTSSESVAISSATQ